MINCLEDNRLYSLASDFYSTDSLSVNFIIFNLYRLFKTVCKSTFLPEVYFFHPYVRRYVLHIIFEESYIFVHVVLKYRLLSRIY